MGEKYPLNLIWIMPAQGSVRISHLVYRFISRDFRQLPSRLLLSGPTLPGTGVNALPGTMRNALNANSGRQLQRQLWSTAINCIGPA